MDIDFTHLDQTIPENMELVDQLVNQHRCHRPLQGVKALFIQHQLGNQYPLAKAMIALGLDPKDLYWLDIPYTSNAKVREALFELKIPKRNFFINQYRVLDFYAPYQNQRMTRILHGFLQNPPDRLLVLDDGAYYLEAAVCFERQIPEVAIVEQTTRGLIKIEQNAAMHFALASIPIINVARSKPKKMLEPPFIGKAVCAALMRKLKSRFEPGHRKRCLILGYGAIGKQLARFIEENLNFDIKKIHVFDPRFSPDSDELSRYQPWHRDDTETLFDLVIGCSGRSSFEVGDYVYLKDGAVLASASSGSVELSRRYFIELADNSDIDDIKIYRDNLDETNIHSDICIHFPGRDVTFINAGFPVNFDGRINCVPARYIQPTMAMMVQAAIQAVNTTESGLIDLNNDFCTSLDQEFRKLLGEEADILPPPSMNNPEVVTTEQTFEPQ